jgi:DNA-binding CsgD family transcriptional regulator
LSRREREIATLVRDGLSNKEIADTPTMSVRTVEGHIHRASNKVGVANRAELGELINRYTPWAKPRAACFSGFKDMVRVVERGLNLA